MICGCNLRKVGLTRVAMRLGAMVEGLGVVMFGRFSVWASDIALVNQRPNNSRRISPGAPRLVGPVIDIPDTFIQVFKRLGSP